MGALDMPLVGRDAELGSLAEPIERLLAEGRGGLVVVEGEPGVGKTRLVEELLRRAESRGVRIARGAALGDAGAPSLALWRSVARALGRGVRGALDRAVADGGLADDARWRRFSAITDAIAEVAARHACIVALDDLHDADAESIELLSFAARDLRSAPVLFVATLRDRATRDPVAGEAALARALRDARGVRLAPLAEKDVHDIVRLAGQAPLADAIHRASRGNPLFVRELLSLAAARGDLTAARVPESIASALSTRLTALSAVAREALDLAALAGAEVRIAFLAPALECSPEDVVARLGGAVRMGVLEDDGSSRLRFAHPLFRETLVGALGADERRSLHARLGDGLERAAQSGLDVPPAEIAHQLASALPRGDARRVLHWLAQAEADAEARLALEEAASLAARAARIAEDAAMPAAERCDLELGAARAASRAGARSVAAAAASRAMGLARAARDARRTARAALARGASFSLGHVDGDLVTSLRSVLAALDPRDVALVARVKARLAAALQPAADPREPLAMANEALALGRACDDRRCLLDVMMSVGSAWADYAPVAERRALAREMGALAVELGDRPVALRATLRLAIDSLDAGDLAACDEAIARHGDIAATLGPPQYRWTLHALRAMRAAMRGDLVGIEAAHAEIRALAERGEDPNATIAMAVQRAVACAEHWDDATLERALDELARGTASIGTMDAYASLTRGAMWARRGDRARAQTYVNELVLAHPAIRADDTTAALLAELVAATAPDRAPELLALALQKEDRCSVWGPFAPAWDGPWSRRVGLLARALGHLDEAVAALVRAVERCRALGAEPHELRAMLDLAETREMRGAEGDAVHAAEARAHVQARAEALALPALRASARRRSAIAPRADASAPLSLFARFVLREEGETWVLEHEGRRHLLRDSRGLRWLARLREEPDRDFHVLELVGSLGADGGTGDRLLDARAMAAYRARISELREQLDEAEANADLGTTERLQGELDALTDQISSALGLGQRARRTASAVERARVNVQRRLKDATGRLAALEPGLAAHLEWAVRTGVLCRYRTR